MACILLGTDGSQNSARATDFAAQLAKSMALALWIVNVTDRFGPSAADLAEFSQAEHISIPEMIESTSAQILDETKDRAEAMGALDVHIETRKGDVAQIIMEMAQEKGATAIVVGRRGRGMLAGLLVGSVAQKLVSLAACAVIVVP